MECWEIISEISSIVTTMTLSRTSHMNMSSNFVLGRMLDNEMDHDQPRTVGLYSMVFLRCADGKPKACYEAPLLRYSILRLAYLSGLLALLTSREGGLGHRRIGEGHF
jgi:hypothetical protein